MLFCRFAAQKAKLLDFPTHSAFVLDMRMAKTPDKVSTFLQDLEERLKPLKQREMDIFLQYKKEDVRSCFAAVCSHSIVGEIPTFFFLH